MIDETTTSTSERPSAGPPPYRQADLPVDVRVEDLIGRMSIEEKVAQLGCLWSTAFIGPADFDEEAAIRSMPHGIGQVTRIGASTSLRPGEVARLMNAIQRVSVERTRLGIPIFVHEECVGGLLQRDATVFPQALGLAATWDPGLVHEVAGVIREQMRAVGARLGLAPVLDVARDPRWGRVEETYGEDPVLTGTLGVAFVRGLQTEDLAGGVAATAKHFLAYAMSQGGRNWGPVNMGPRELREVYAEPFAAAIRDAGLGAVMNSYASIDGQPCAGSREILTDLLRGELGFDGVVIADYWAIGQLQHHHRVARDPGAAAALALTAGLDLEAPDASCYGAPLIAEVERGRVPMEVVDTAVRRVLRLKFQLGLFERPYVDDARAEAQFDAPRHRDLARAAAAKGTVLLTNDGVLPVAPGVRRIAVIGPGADDQRLLQGDYHYPAHFEGKFAEDALPDAQDRTLMPVPRLEGPAAPGPHYTRHVTPLVALREALGDTADIRHERGCGVLGDDRSGLPAAVDAAREAELTIAIVAGKSGLRRPATVGEANDAMHLGLTGVQEELVRSLAATGTPLVVVVLSGRVHDLSEVAEHANALIQLFPPGEEGGHGLCDVLTGAVSPSGRLPVTLPRSVGQVPIHHGQRAGGDVAMFFGDYVDGQTDPLFPFGHGLSYTGFEYAGLTVRGGATTDPIEVAVSVRNVGRRDGDEVVQLYATDLVASVARPARMLVGFARVPLRSGEARRIVFRVHPSRLAFFDAAMRFVVEPGEFAFAVGSSSVAIGAEDRVTLDGETAVYLQRSIVATGVELDGGSA